MKIRFPKNIDGKVDGINGNNEEKKINSVKEITENKFARNFTEHKLRNFTSNIIVKDDEDDVMTIWLDWPLKIHLFSIYNIRAFESLLTVYPSVHYKVLLPSPINNNNNNINPYKKTKNYYLSESHFFKYKKKGYDVQIERTGKMKKGHTSHIAKHYWSKWVKIFCTYNSENERTVPYHVLTFIRLSKLWRRGGIFSDFSFFFLSPTDAPLITQVSII